MTHRRINFATALSLLVCAAVVALWVRSYVVGDGVGYDEGGTWSRLVLFHSSMGRTWAAVGTAWSEHSRDRGWFHSATPAKPLVIWNTDQPLWEPLGIAGGRADSAVFDSFEVALPHWLLVLGIGALPGWRFIRRGIQRSRRGRGLCPQCGYDLRASASGCPECGPPQELRSPPS